MPLWHPRRRREMGERATARAVDVTDDKAVADAAAVTAEQIGGVEILVNNAGISGPNVPTWEYPVDDWRQVLDIDLNGVFYCCRAIVPIMLKGDYGRIVNIASISLLRVKRAIRECTRI